MSTPEPLRGPAFGSYPPDEVGWLLTDLSDVALEAPTEEREEAVQSGGAHYAESLPHEYQPDAEYLQLYHDALAGSAGRLAQAVGTVTELVLAERGPDVVLASLARAGTPVGGPAAPLGGRPARARRCRTTRCRSCAAAASTRSRCATSAEHHDPARVVFVDGWTGKGAIARELAAALAEHGGGFDPDLAVLADPGPVRRTFGTREDWLIPSACLNSTVSGLVSRTVLNTRLLRPDQYHGAKFYAELAAADVSNDFLDAVAAEFDAVRDTAPPARPRPGLGRLGGRRAHRRRVRHRRPEPGQARRRRDHPGAAAPGAVAGAGPGRTPRPPTSPTCGCSRSAAASRSRRWPSCPTAASA